MFLLEWNIPLHPYVYLFDGLGWIHTIFPDSNYIVYVVNKNYYRMLGIKIYKGSKLFTWVLGFPILLICGFYFSSCQKFAV